MANPDPARPPTRTQTLATTRLWQAMKICLTYLGELSAAAGKARCCVRVRVRVRVEVRVRVMATVTVTVKVKVKVTVSKVPLHFCGPYTLHHALVVRTHTCVVLLQLNVDALTCLDLARSQGAGDAGAESVASRLMQTNPVREARGWK